MTTQTILEPARKLSRPLSRPTVLWRRLGSPVVRRTAPLAGHLAVTATEPRRSWPPSAAGRKTTVKRITWLQDLACNHLINSIHSQHAASGPAGSRNHLCRFGVHLTDSG
jgi:hypothetical protein